MVLLLEKIRTILLLLLLVFLILIVMILMKNIISKLGIIFRLIIPRKLRMKANQFAASLAPRLSSSSNAQLVLAALESRHLSRPILAGASVVTVVESIVQKSPRLECHPFVQRVRLETIMTENSNNLPQNSQ